ncbi:hypothetical protein [Vibrio phage PhiImVa-1]|nr:hypothetical protein [Vibrio phage PhiImVa-1]UOX40322.1 hypothetical protein [Vibrio phage PhiImVa-1]
MQLLKAYHHVDDLVLRIPLDSDVVINLPSDPQLQVFPYGRDTIKRLIEKGDWARNAIGSKL